MDTSKVYSDFQLQGVRIADLSVKNDFINSPDLSNSDLSINLGNNKIKIEKIGEELGSELCLSVNICLTEKTDNKRIEISLTLESFFTTSDLDEDNFKQMLLLNGNSTLYSIARSHVITISALSFDSGKIVLPMINFMELLNERNKKEIEE